MPPKLCVSQEDARSPDAGRLLAEMCADLSARYHRLPSPFLPEEAMTARAAFVVARLDGRPVGCGALRQIDDQSVEVKRMFVVPSARRQGISRRLLEELERLAGVFGYSKVILETGQYQPEALALYHSAGYRKTEPYGRYVDDPLAQCFEKIVKRGSPPSSPVL